MPFCAKADNFIGGVPGTLFRLLVFAALLLDEAPFIALFSVVAVVKRCLQGELPDPSTSSCAAPRRRALGLRARWSGLLRVDILEQ